MAVSRFTSSIDSTRKGGLGLGHPERGDLPNKASEKKQHFIGWLFQTSNEERRHAQEDSGKKSIR